jgi:hypothetical protein
LERNFILNGKIDVSPSPLISVTVVLLFILAVFGVVGAADFNEAEETAKSECTQMLNGMHFSEAQYAEAFRSCTNGEKAKP